ncbi:MAG: hypothetical protein KDM63_20000, partial [Verrucomicrobiae bacterium]|nr:hypothetical protein [Verrucomicrobiae bacterium]
MLRPTLIILLAAGLFALMILPAPSQTASPSETPKAKTKAKAPANAKAKANAKKAAGPSPAPPAALSSDVLSLTQENHQLDFPAICAAPDGSIWFAYVNHDGASDAVWLGRRSDKGLEPVAQLSEPGIIHQPAIATDGTGRIWVCWGQTGDDDVVHLHARSWHDGSAGELVALAKSGGSDTFADAGTDAAGRVWVTWQSMRAGEGDIFARYLNPETGQWSDELTVTKETGGDWEPRIAFDGNDGTWILYDSSRGNEFNLYLAHVSLDGKVETFPIGHSPRFEGRADIAASRDGQSLWIAAERGRGRWGLDVRGHDNDKGINAQKK